MKGVNNELDKLNLMDKSKGRAKAQPVGWVDPHADLSMEAIQAEKEAARKAKLLKQEEETKAQANAPESMEERAARLRAQRDIIKKQKEEKRLKELDQFNKNMVQVTSAPS